MSGRPVGALAGIAMILTLAVPARAALPSSASPQGVLDGLEAASAVPDVVLGKPTAAAARISASAQAGRYAVNDGSGATIAVAVTAACQVSCTNADPQGIADFIGTLVHGAEIDLLTVQLDTPPQLGSDCGFDAQACYYGSQSKIVVSGDEALGPGATEGELALAHEYGHHVARHRESPAPFPPAIDWGTARWATYAKVCQGRRAGFLFPGNEALRYYRDPGEAFAEAFARNRFPDAGEGWKWLSSLKPDAGAFRAIRRDTLDPWRGRTSLVLSGHVPPRGDGVALRSFRTPVDGAVSLRPAGQPRGYELSVTNAAGRVLRSSQHGLSFRGDLNVTVCGEPRLDVSIRSTRRSGGSFRLLIQRP